VTAFQHFGKSHFKNREKTPPLHVEAGQEQPQLATIEHRTIEQFVTISSHL
jgi:hypothetical protein